MLAGKEQKLQGARSHYHQSCRNTCQLLQSPRWGRPELSTPARHQASSHSAHQWAGTCEALLLRGLHTQHEGLAHRLLCMNYLLGLFGVSETDPPGPLGN